MDNNMENNVVENEEVNNVEETVEEAVEETVETEENIVEEEVMADVIEELDVAEAEIKKDSKNGYIIAIAVMAVVIIILGGLHIYNIFGGKNKDTNMQDAYTLLDIYKQNHEIYLNERKQSEEEKAKSTEKYNNLGFANVSGMTIGEICKEEGASIDSLILQYSLPGDITEDTYWDVAGYLAPVSIRIGLQTLKDEYNLTHITTDSGEKIEITDDMPFGLVYDEFALKDLVSEEQFEEFKAEYGLGEDVTLETKMKEVRSVIEKAEIEKREEEEAAEKAAEEAAESENAEAPEQSEESNEEPAADAAE